MDRQGFAIPTMRDGTPDKSRMEIVGVILEDTGLRILLGPDGTDGTPELVIERRPENWIVYVFRDGDQTKIIL